MTNIKKILIFVIMLMPVMVYADDDNFELTLECSSSQIKVNETMACTISINPPAEVRDSAIVVSVDGGLGFVQQNGIYFAANTTLCDSSAFKCEGGITSTGTLDIEISTSSAAAAGIKTTLGTFYVKTSNNATVGSSYNIQITDGDFMNGMTTVKKDLTASTSLTVVDAPVQTATGLKSLRVVSGGIMNKTFDSNTFRYAIQLDSADTTKFKLSAEAVNSADTIKVVDESGTEFELSKDIDFIPDDSGSMRIIITVGSGSNAVVYNLIVNRPTPQGVGKPTLKSLIIGGNTVALVNDTFDYTVTLDADSIKNYTVVAELSDPDNFRFKNSDVLSPHELSGAQEFMISIVSKDGKAYGSENYIITVKAAEGGSGTTPTSPTPIQETPKSNPSTGSGSAIFMGILLVVSFAASMYYYKKNMSQYN